MPHPAPVEAWLDRAAARLHDPALLQSLPDAAVAEELDALGLTRTVPPLRRTVDRLIAEPQAASGTAPDRAPLRLVSLQRVTAGAFALAALYAVLFLGGRALEPRAHGFAVAGSELGFTADGAEAKGEGAEGAAEALAEGTRLLLSARRSTLGLFPRYDEGQLELARRQLQIAYDGFAPQTLDLGRLGTAETGGDPARRAAAALLIARTWLAQNEVPVARTWVERALEAAGDDEGAAPVRAEALSLQDQLAEAFPA